MRVLLMRRCHLTFHDVSGGIDIYDDLPHVAPLYGVIGGVCTYWSYRLLGSVPLVYLAAVYLVQVSLMVGWIGLWKSYMSSPGQIFPCRCGR